MEVLGEEKLGHKPLWIDHKVAGGAHAWRNWMGECDRGKRPPDVQSGIWESYLNETRMTKDSLTPLRAERQVPKAQSIKTWMYSRGREVGWQGMLWIEVLSLLQQSCVSGSVLKTPSYPTWMFFLSLRWWLNGQSTCHTNVRNWITRTFVYWDCVETWGCSEVFWPAGLACTVPNNSNKGPVSNKVKIEDQR